ncbi:hypothetical protein TNCV_2245341 [Trichonephila clavipes]|nr:hypothetical protein TNCV_2245341 [Trichonephila clavipes]
MDILDSRGKKNKVDSLFINIELISNMTAIGDLSIFNHSQVTRATPKLTPLSKTFYTTLTQGLRASPGLGLTSDQKESQPQILDCNHLATAAKTQG